MVEGIDFFVRLIDFPVCSCGGMIMPNDDGTYSMYINSRLSIAQQRRAYKHELLHLERGDLYSNKPIEELENI